jgi:hypothetical protein
MSNRIQAIRIWNRRLDPAQAEVVIEVMPEKLSAATEVRGRLMGPRCPYAATVEVAYPLREASRPGETAASAALRMRVVLPEASFWDPQSPFLYEGPVELWENGMRCDTVPVRHGLRRLHLGPRGLRCNARRLTVQGAMRDRCSEDEALRLHQSGYNALLAPVGAATEPLWDIGDRFGFLMLGRLQSPDDLPRAVVLSRHPSCLGWVVAWPLLDDPAVPSALASGEAVIGVEQHGLPAGPLPAWVSFVVCPEEVLPTWTDVGLWKIVTRPGPGGTNGQTSGALPAGVVGSIERS